MTIPNVEVGRWLRYNGFMATPTSALARQVATAVRASLNPSQILLFGSVARGTPHGNSDLDYCLVFDTLPLRKIEVLRQARRAALTVYRGAVDFVAYSSVEWQSYLDASSSFETNLKREAIAL